MPRKLPWKTNSGTSVSPAVKPPRAAVTPASSRASDELTPSRVTTPPGRRTQTTTPNPIPTSLRSNRTPSTSPPPAPPQEELMIDGPENDDRYRMVEDELSSVASLFTAHLHAAEYQRLKQRARSRNAETIQDMSRPVVGPLTEAARTRQELRRKTARQREALKKAAGRSQRDLDASGDETAELPWQGTSLQHLMASPQKRGLPLTALAGGIGTTTRAGAGFGQETAETGFATQRPGTVLGRNGHAASEQHAKRLDGKHKLGGPWARVEARLSSVSRQPELVEPVLPTRNLTSPLISSNRSTASTLNRSHTWAATDTGLNGGAQRTVPAATEEDSEGDDYDPFRRSRKRQEEKRKRRETQQLASKKAAKEETKEEDLDIIPSFL